MKYQSRQWRFELEFPVGWGEPGFFKRFLSFRRYAQQSTQPEFYGPGGASLKLSIGPISPIPSLREQQRNLELIGAKYGHKVIEVGEIEVGGKLHATMLCDIPGVGVVKNYSLIFHEKEYLVTAQGDWNECDSIVKSFKSV